ncbi:hypothetical protein [Parasitella parasitica]|uniref:Uncharacterized protein n=1 Tax=Parasitella parasitica TaxID=35722 RepID=A0A0B7N7J1_9FUNG|nr:hypothetical protein [Parasitella parasitica]
MHFIHLWFFSARDVRLQRNERLSDQTFSLHMLLFVLADSGSGDTNQNEKSVRARIIVQAVNLSTDYTVQHDNRLQGGVAH